MCSSNNNQIDGLSSTLELEIWKAIRLKMDKF